MGRPRKIRSLPIIEQTTLYTVKLLETVSGLERKAHQTHTYKPEPHSYYAVVAEVVCGNTKFCKLNVPGVILWVLDNQIERVS